MSDIPPAQTFLYRIMVVSSYSTVLKFWVIITGGASATTGTKGKLTNNLKKSFFMGLIYKVSILWKKREKILEAFLINIRCDFPSTSRNSISGIFQHLSNCHYIALYNL